MARKNAEASAAAEEPRPEGEAPAPARPEKPEKAEIEAAKALASELVGKPWREGAEGPDAFDCWTLARHVRRALFGDELPDVGDLAMLTFPQLRIALVAAAQRQGWMPVPGPRHGAIVILGRQQRPHIGIFLAVPPGPGRILHCDETGGVMFETVAHLQAQGWQRARWYARVGEAEA